MGVYIDSSLSWKQQVAYLCRKIRPVVGVISKLQHLLPAVLLKTVYFSLFHSHVSYCVETWGAADATIIKPVVTLQNKVVRIIDGCNYGNTNTNTGNTSNKRYKNCGILKLHDIYFMRICTLVYSELNSTDSVVKYGFCSSNSHSHGTRYVKNDLLPIIAHRTNFFKKSILHAGIHCYNHIPTDLKNSKSIYQFKRKLKDWVIDKNVDIYKILTPFK